MTGFKATVCASTEDNRYDCAGVPLPDGVSKQKANDVAALKWYKSWVKVGQGGT